MGRPVAKRGEGRQRVLDAAVALFAEHGVRGTSLQMIAEELGVTKAAVYFQFHSKDEIVLAVIDPAVRQLASVVESAEAAPSRDEQIDLAVAGIVDLALDHARIVAVLQNDPVVTRLMREHEPLHSLTDRLSRVLIGQDPTPLTRVAVSVVARGLLVTRTDPLLADLDDETLRREMLRVAGEAVRAAADVGVPG